MNNDGMITTDMMRHMATTIAYFGVWVAVKISDGDEEFYKIGSREAQRMRLIGALYCN